YKDLGSVRGKGEDVPVKYRYELERAIVPFSVVLDIPDDRVRPPQAFHRGRTAPPAWRIVMAFTSRRAALDAVGVRPSSLHLSHSSSAARSAAAGNRECVASGTSRLASRSGQGLSASGVWFGCFGNLVWSSLL